MIPIQLENAGCAKLEIICKTILFQSDETSTYVDDNLVTFNQLWTCILGIQIKLYNNVPT